MPGTPMEPMDSYLCVLLDLSLINANVTYTQTQICSIIAGNQTSFDTIYTDPVKLSAARIQYLSTAQNIIVIDKREDCEPD